LGKPCPSQFAAPFPHGERIKALLSEFPENPLELATNVYCGKTSSQRSLTQIDPGKFHEKRLAHRKEAEKVSK